jgi:hypothetical protein
MLSHLSSLARSSVIALAALASVPAAAPAAPLGPTFIPAVADSGTSKPILVEMGEGRDHGPGYGIWPRRGGGNWNGGGRNWGGGNWNRGGRHWGGGNWNNGRAYRHYGGNYRRHWRGNGWNNGGAFALGLGLGVPLGYYGGYGGYGGYDGYYDDPYYAVPVYRPRVIQRRIYRGGGSAHVEWCYNRYRSYRAWDNTFQPYNGPRQQCYSPYS